MIQVRVVMMRYQEGLQNFPEDALRTATFGKTVLDVREYSASGRLTRNARRRGELSGAVLTWFSKCVKNGYWYVLRGTLMFRMRRFGKDRCGYDDRYRVPPQSVFAEMHGRYRSTVCGTRPICL